MSQAVRRPGTALVVLLLLVKMGGQRVENLKYDERLSRHLAAWLGRWPLRQGTLEVVGFQERLQPAWDGGRYPAIGVATPSDAVLSVPPEHAEAVRRACEGFGPDWEALDRLVHVLPAALGLPGCGGYRAIFRFSTRPKPLADAGVWLPARDPGVAGWLRAFDGDVLLARDPDDGTYLAGVGIKRHDRYGHELAVGTAPAARGRGLARRLVAQAARRVLDEGAVPTYQHDPRNAASARVADAAGFPDRGWSSFGVGALGTPVQPEHAERRPLPRR